MSLSFRLILSFTALIAVGFFFLTDWIVEDLRPRYLESVEEVLVDQAQLLASILETDIAQNHRLSFATLAPSFDKVYRRRFQAKIYELTKTDVDLQVYVTNQNGIVLFHSKKKGEEGKNYSRWNDVRNTLNGRYGARASEDPEDPSNSLLHVAAPIFSGGEIVGSITLIKSTQSINQFIETAQPKLWIAAGIASASILVLGMVSFVWLTRPIKRLKNYALAIEQGKNASFPSLHQDEIGKMGEAFEKMREALEGKRYVEHYVQTLTHEIKSPLSAIQGASELLEEEMPADKRKKFLKNIQTETERIQTLIDRLLKLASVESRKRLEQIEKIEATEIATSVFSKIRWKIEAKKISPILQIQEGLRFEGERFLIEQALLNLVQNAAEFAFPNSRLWFSITKEDSKIVFKIEDEGPGIPDFAIARIFERFYSLPRPDTGKKSTGLGLSFVREVAKLHSGSLRVENRSEGRGVRVELVLPCMQS